jgi:hypothetical protein
MSFYICFPFSVQTFFTAATGPRVIFRIFALHAKNSSSAKRHRLFFFSRKKSSFHLTGFSFFGALARTPPSRAKCALKILVVLNLNGLKCSLCKKIKCVKKPKDHFMSNV